ncbi:MAG: dihydrofolate reductase family protein, partial [Patescibacteria group bacterium]|nr:dihydrofolate reductase family protein [Patescibacteria group bacterium]
LSKRDCIVLTSSVATTERKNDKLLFWNPATVPYTSVLQNTSIEIVAVLGGAQTYSYFLKNNLIDELYLTIEPIVFGRGIPLLADVGENQANFRLISKKQLNEKGTMLLHYKIA